LATAFLVALTPLLSYEQRSAPVSREWCYP
jgi:hypothetical protein